MHKTCYAVSIFVDLYLQQFDGIKLNGLFGIFLFFNLVFILGKMQSGKGGGGVQGNNLK